MGVLVMGGALSMFVAIVRVNSEMLDAARLEEELAVLTAYMTREIRRAGYTPASFNPDVSSDNTSFAPLVLVDRNGDGKADCLLFSYDMDGDGVFDDGKQSTPGKNSDERFGFRLDRVHGAIEQSRSGRNCQEKRWEDLTDPTAIRVTDLTFGLRSSALSHSKGKVLERRRLTIRIKAQLRGDPSVTSRRQEFLLLPNDLLRN